MSQVQYSASQIIIVPSSDKWSSLGYKQEHRVDLEEEYEDLQGLAFTITLCILGVQDINLVIHRSHSLFIGAWDGGTLSN